MTRRTDRIAEAIRRIASEIIPNDIKDPRVKGFITITKAEVTPDLKLAKIYYSVLGGDKNKKLIAQGLKSAKSFVRMRIADELKLRCATDVVFKIDETAEAKEGVEEILNKLREEKGQNEDNRENNQGT